VEFLQDRFAARRVPMQLNKSVKLLDAVGAEVPGSSAQWIKEQPTLIVPNVGNNVHNNFY
jgi:hypothetical protein